jgi:hypothetical protein
MATSRKLGLTRDQLASFLDDFEKIKQFERLFSAVDTVIDETGGDGFTLAESAAAKAEQAQGAVDALGQEALASLAAVEARASYALAAIDRLRQDVEGLQCLPPPREAKRARYGSFYDTTTQTAALANTEELITFDTTDLSSGVRRGSTTSQIIVDEPGVYNFQTSIQLDKTSGGTERFWLWWKKNGSAVADSASEVQIQGNNAEIFISMNYFFQLKPNDYVELAWAVSDVSVELLSRAAAAPVPAIPSVILTVSNNIEG